MFLHALATTLIIGPLAFIMGAWWVSLRFQDSAGPRPLILSLKGGNELIRASVDDMLEQIRFFSSDRDRASDIAGRLQLKMDAIRDLIETPRTIRKGDLRGIVGE